jgi:hypothetical protein
MVLCIAGIYIFANCFKEYGLEGEYKYVTGDNNNEVKVKKFLEDLKNIKHWIKFLIENMPSK